MKARRTTFSPLLLLISAVFMCISPTSQAQDTVHVSAGWNIIGSVKDGAVPDVLSTDPPGIIATEFYGYSPGLGYASTDTLTKGLGYWVKVSSDGIIVFNTATSISDLCGAKRVWYGGKIYHTVQIGSQCWLEENMNVGTMITGETAQTDNATLEKWCYNDDPLNCSLYGGLYKWDEAMQYTTTAGGQGICPPGYHIPTQTEYQTLSTTVGGNSNALKAVGQGGGGGAGTNTSGFSALLAGSKGAGFENLGSYAYIWCSSTPDVTNGHRVVMNNVNASIFLNSINKVQGHSVRCLED